MDESDLAAGFCTGEPGAVRAVYERYAGAVFTIALRVLDDRGLAADAVQTTFLNAWRARASVDGSRPLAPWLYTIARRATIDLYRTERRVPRPSGSGADLEDRLVTLSPSLVGLWEAWQVQLAVSALPAQENEVVHAQHYLDLTHSQIAMQLGIPLGTVKSRTHRAHRRLTLALGHLMPVAS